MSTPGDGNTTSNTSIRDEKRRRFAAKQERVAKQKLLVEDRAAIFFASSTSADHATDRHNFFHAVSVSDVERIKQQQQDEDKDKKESMKGAAALSVSAEKRSLLSPLEQLLRPYFNLQDIGAASTRNDHGNSNNEQLFIAEGTETVRLLLQQYSSTQHPTSETEGRLQPIEIKSIFLKPNLLFEEPVRLLTDVERAMDGSTISDTTKLDKPPGFHVLVAPEEVLTAAAGFAISRGCLACGVVPTVGRDEAGLFAYLQKKMLQMQQKLENPFNCSGPPHLRLLALDGISDTANLGAMIRTASAFGVDAIILSRDCCDAWYRRAVRVSMGHVFVVPTFRVPNLADTLRKLRYGGGAAASADGGNGCNVSPLMFPLTSFAAVIDANASFLLRDLKKGKVPNSWCCVMGSEANGISKDVVQACQHTLRIDMVQGVDSLSVPIAAGILLNGLREREQSDFGDTESDN